eukprot:gene6587-9404_t
METLGGTSQQQQQQQQQQQPTAAGGGDDKRKRERELKKEKQGQYYQQEWLSKATHINEEAKCKLVSRLEFICDGGLDSYIPYTLEVIRYEAEKLGRGGRLLALILEKHILDDGKIICNLIHCGEEVSISETIARRSFSRSYCSPEIEMLLPTMGFRGVRYEYQRGIAFSYNSIIHLQLYKEYISPFPLKLPEIPEMPHYTAFAWSATTDSTKYQ